ncbi:uncharacterized protein PG998_012108 [Apiospora kogelbergensis]|uniref:uncharacterized protein n=1 Tax=Apiospora kogelbergensis TaxID=1337665 RepID=UPI00312EA053
MSDLKRKGTVRRQKKDSNVRDQGIKQLYPEKDTYVPEVDIVLVPGLATNPEECWGDKNFNWPTDSLAKDFPKSRILLYMFESEWKGTFKVKQFMDNLAMGLLKGIDANRDKESERRPIVFIGHSMGGLIIAKAVVLADFHRKRFPVLFEAITSTVFFGTPFKGSEAAVVGSMVSSFGESFGQTVPTKLLEFMEPGNSQIRELVDQFTNRVRQVSPNIAITCFWEQHETTLSGLMKAPSAWPTIPLPEKLAMFVTRESATLEGYDNFGLNANHRGLVKFSSAQDSPFKMVRHEIKDLVNAAEYTVKGRMNSVSGIDRDMINGIDDALGGSYTPARRKAATGTFAPSPWITEEPEYIAWLAEDSPKDGSSTTKPGDCLWVRAHEGRGKTSASMAVITHYEQREAVARKQNPVRIAYFFCEQSQYFCTAEDILQSLIRQLIKQQESLAPYARLFIKKAKGDTSQAQITIENLWQALQDMLTDAFVGSKVIFVLNNLHVLPETSTSTDKLMKFINAELRDMHEMGSRRVLTRWFITSRDVHHVGEALAVDGVRLVDLQDPKYKNQVQINLKEAAKSKVEALVKKKNYSKALAYFVGSVLGKRAQNTQWIDISYVQLVELDPHVNDLKVRRVIETLPQDLRILLNQAWYQVFKANSGDHDTITEILRTLILTYESPTEQELGILAGLGTSEEDKKDLHRLIEICKPLLSVQHGKVSFINSVVKSHLLENAKDLLDMSAQEIKWQHGVIALRCFERIKEAFDVEIDLDDESEEDEAGDDSDDDSDNESDSNESDDNEDWDGESQSDASDDDPEVDKVYGLAEEYMVKHWLRHASKATFEIAEDLSAEEDFWEPGSHEVVERDELNNTPLHLAAEFGRTKIIQELLNHNAPVNDGIDGDGTPLHMAAYSGHIEAMEILLRRGADPIGASDEEGPVVNAAISSGNQKAVELIVNQGVPLVMEGNFDSPLALAALLSNPSMFEYLIDKYADRLPAEEYSKALVKSAEAKRTEVFNKLLEFEHDDVYFQRALDAASEKRNWDIVKVLIELRPGLDCNSLFVSAAGVNDDKDDLLRVAWDFSKGTIRRETVDRALYVATDCEKTSTVEILLAEPYRASPNATGPEYGNALTASAHDGTEDIIDMLLEAGAGVNDPAGWALQAAAAKGHKDIVVRFLKQEGADVNAFTKNENFPAGTALQAACEAGELGIVELLLAHGADPNGGGGDEGPPVIAATKHVEDEILQRLVRAGAALDIRGGADASTPLTNAAACYNVDAVRMLLDAGADINLADGAGNTPLMVACAEEDCGAIAQVLLERGADILCVNDEGKNALQIAFEAEEEYCVELLVDRTSALFTALREAMQGGTWR